MLKTNVKEKDFSGSSRKDHNLIGVRKPKYWNSSRHFKSYLIQIIHGYEWRLLGHKNGPRVWHAWTISWRQPNVSWSLNMGQDSEGRSSDMGIIGVRKGTTDRRHRNRSISEEQAQQIPGNWGKSECVISMGTDCAGL